MPNTFFWPYLRQLCMLSGLAEDAGASGREAAGIVSVATVLVQVGNAVSKGLSK